jgi:hypothetical protein
MTFQISAAGPPSPTSSGLSPHFAMLRRSGVVSIFRGTSLGSATIRIKQLENRSASWVPASIPKCLQCWRKKTDAYRLGDSRATG